MNSFTNKEVELSNCKEKNKDFNDLSARKNHQIKVLSISQLSTEHCLAWLDMLDTGCLNVNHKLTALLPSKTVQHRELSSNRKFNKPLCKKKIALRTVLFLAIVTRGIFFPFSLALS